jgi:hypothetical protein
MPINKLHGFPILDLNCATAHAQQGDTTNLGRWVHVFKLARVS